MVSKVSPVVALSLSPLLSLPVVEAVPAKPLLHSPWPRFVIVMFVMVVMVVMVPTHRAISGALSSCQASSAGKESSQELHKVNENRQHIIAVLECYIRIIFTSHDTTDNTDNISELVHFLLAPLTALACLA